MEVQILERRWLNAKGEAVTDWLPETCTNWEVGAIVCGIPVYESFLKGTRESASGFPYANGRAAYRFESRIQVYRRAE